MKLRLLITGMTSALLLTACGGKPSVEDLKNNQELLKKTLQNCKKLGAGAVDDEGCMNAIKAIQLMMKERMEKRLKR